MTKKALWQHIKELIDCDNTISSLENEIARSKQIVADNTNQINQLTHNISDKKERIFDAKKNVDLQELQIKTYKAKEDEKEGKLNTIVDPKAYKALEKELEMINFKRVQLEDEVLDLQEALTNNEKTFTEEIAAAEEKIKTLQHENQLKEENKIDLQKKLDIALNDRSQVTPTVPAEWLSTYERMKQNVKDPIVPVQNSLCSACFYNILYQDLVKLKKSHVLLCRNCYRFLYYKEEEEQAKTQTSY